MAKRSLGVLAAGVAVALLLGGQTTATAEPRAVPMFQPDPALMFPSNPAKTDWAAVVRHRETKAQARRHRVGTQAALPYQEKEPAGTTGANDTPATAEHITGFGTRARADSKVALTGDIRRDDTIPTLPPFPETNDAISLAADTGISGARRAVRTSGAIGDGPHGSAGDGTGDFDFYRLDGGASGVTFAARTSTPTGDLDTMLALWDTSGGLWVISGDSGGSTDSAVTFAIPPDQTFYLMVGSDPFALPRDPTTPGTGPGVGTEGPYDLLITSGKSGGDLDYYSFDLRAGDVLGAAVAGGGTRLAVHDPAGREVFGSSQDLTGTFALDSPMPGGGNAVVDFVAPADGRYRIGVEAGEGPYDIKLEAFRPGTETARRGSVHTIFLDFDGARVNTVIYGGGGLRDLSPLSSFLPRWGLTAGDERALITAITATVRENLERDMIAKGINPRLALRVLNSRDHADPWGQPNVSRVVVGGTIAESGISTIGIAQSIDAGNFGREETALVLLDEISSPAGAAWSLNTYVGPTSDEIAFIGRAVGNITSHEAGHMSGSWHTNGLNDVHGIMDPGGNPAVMFAVGPDGVGGTADDPDLDFTTDELSPAEGFTGTEDTVARTAWAFVRGTG